jgi:hypothetical protein
LISDWSSYLYKGPRDRLGTLSDAGVSSYGIQPLVEVAGGQADYAPDDIEMEREEDARGQISERDDMDVDMYAAEMAHEKGRYPLIHVKPVANCIMCRR